MSLSFTYDPDIIPARHDEGQDYYVSPRENTMVTLSLGHATYKMTQDFSLAVLPHHAEIGGVNGDETWSGDYAVFSAGERLSATNPVGVQVFARMVFSDGSFQGGPKLPNFPPTNAFISFGIDEGNIHSDGFSITTGQATFSPVPEPATYGLVGSLALLGLVTRRLKLKKQPLITAKRPTSLLPAEKDS